MTTFTSIDLSGLPSPDVVERLDFETILAEMVADLKGRDKTFSALVESDPAYIVLEVAAYREVELRQRVNDAAKAVMLAYAMGGDLDNLAALVPMARKVEVTGDAEAVPPTEDQMESNDDFRARVQLAPEGFSTAGPDGAYIFHALTVPGVKSASVASPNPGEVTVYVLGLDGDGSPSAEVLAATVEALSADDTRPLTDEVTVEAATINPYKVSATLIVKDGPATDSVVGASLKNLLEYLPTRHAMETIVPISGIYKSLHVSGIDKVVMASPAEDVAVATAEAAYCTSITLNEGGRKILTGNEAPTADVGEDGEYYVDTSTWMIHGPKTAGEWPEGKALPGINVEGS